MEADKKIPETKILGAYGRPAPRRLVAILEENGNEFGDLTQEGRFEYANTDATADWTDWCYEITSLEIPDKPIVKLFP